MTFCYPCRAFALLTRALHRLCVRLATNLLQITEFTIKHLVKASLFRRILPRNWGWIPLVQLCTFYRTTRKLDLLTLRAQCLAHDLPDPLEPLEIDGTLLPRYVHSRRAACVHLLHAEEESIKLFHDYLDLHRSSPNLDVQMVPVSVMFGRAPGREKAK